MRAEVPRDGRVGQAGRERPSNALSSGPGSYPAYNPAVVAVGGTALTLAPDGSVSSEQTWADSGGGRSFVEPEPSYQDGV